MFMSCTFLYCVSNIMQNAVCPTLLQPIKKLLEIVDFRKQEETELLKI